MKGNCAVVLVAVVVVCASHVEGMGVHVKGTIFCSPTGNPMMNNGVLTKGLSGVNVTLTCGNTTDVGVAATNAGGMFNIIANVTASALIGDLLSGRQCQVQVNLATLNRSSCDLLPMKGKIIAPAISPVLIDNVLCLVLGSCNVAL